MDNIKKLITRADNLARIFTKQRDGHRCRKCGCIGELHWCHVFTRGCKNIRHYEDNNFTLCSKDHEYFDKHKKEFYRWVRNEIGYKCWLNLLVLKNNPHPITAEFMKNVIVGLKNKIKRIDK